MNILQYELLDAPSGTVNNLLGEMVKQVRHGYLELSIEDFKALLVETKKIEAQLQAIDSEIGRPVRHYIQEIMDELAKQLKCEEELVEHIEWNLHQIIAKHFNMEVEVTTFFFTFYHEYGNSWLLFHGYPKGQEEDKRLSLARDIFRSTCNKFGVLFIDRSDNRFR